MTEAQEHFRKQLLAKIHTTPMYKQIKENDAWEDFLSYRFGVESCKELSINELNIVLDILRGKNIEVESYEPDIAGRNALNPSKITQKQITQILALQDELGWSEVNLRKFILKQTKVLSGVNNMSKENATKLIIGLKKVVKYNANKEK